MKTMNKTATKSFLSLIHGLAAGEDRRIDNAPGAFMAVSVDVLRVEVGVEGYTRKLVAVAHRYEQNGDLVSDPDVEFFVVEGVGATLVYPTAIDQAFGYRREVEMNGLQVTGYRPRGQADLTVFCNLWMKNIKAQQGDLSPAPRGEVTAAA